MVGDLVFMRLLNQLRYMLFYILISQSTQVYALETDNFMVWDRDLKDSSLEINKLFKKEIDAVLNSTNSKGSPISCKKLTLKIAKRFKTYPPLNIFIEH